MFAVFEDVMVLQYTVYTEENKPVNFKPDMNGGAGCCIIVEGKVLLLQRCPSKKMYGGTWGIPAGKLEDGEKPEQAARRETLEEAGIDIPASSMNYRGTLYFSVQHATPLNYCFYVYAVHLSERPAVILEPDQVAFQWVTFDEALQLPTITGAQEVLELGMR